MSIGSETLSAYLDGELTPTEMTAVEEALETDAALQAELEALMAADTVVKAEFDAMLAEPVPVALAAAIKGAEGPMRAANLSRPPRGLFQVAAATALVALFVGGAGGYFAGLSQAPVQVVQAGWLQDIADYHDVYSKQVRHLVEVGAEEADHIETWLTGTVGAEVRIPDLATHGLTFQGGRLLVAAGKPVAQLIFTDAEDRVVALCLIQNDAPNTTVDERQIGAYDMVTWGGAGANFVLVGDAGREDLIDIAQTARDV
ncbi:MAG: anti-sigma factor [Pseudomonadota bacterium]